MAVQSIVSSQANPMSIHTQEILKSGVLHTSMDRGDQVMLSSPRVGQMANDVAQEASEATTAMGIDPAQALSVHSKLDINRAMHLLEGLDEI